jgi:hypothetical protein
LCGPPGRRLVHAQDAFAAGVAGADLARAAEVADALQVIDHRFRRHGDAELAVAGVGADLDHVVDAGDVIVDGEAGKHAAEAARETGDAA